jgi:hypothetical protein
MSGRRKKEEGRRKKGEQRNRNSPNLPISPSNPLPLSSSSNLPLSSSPALLISPLLISRSPHLPIEPWQTEAPPALV